MRTGPGVSYACCVAYGVAVGGNWGQLKSSPQGYNVLGKDSGHRLAARNHNFDSAFFCLGEPGLESARSRIKSSPDSVRDQWRVDAASRL